MKPIAFAFLALVCAATLPAAPDRTRVVAALENQSSFALLWRDWYAYGPGDSASMTGEAEALHTAAAIARIAPEVDADLVLTLEVLAEATKAWAAKHATSTVERLAYAGREHGYRLAAYMVALEVAKPSARADSTTPPPPHKESFLQ